MFSAPVSLHRHMRPAASSMMAVLLLAPLAASAETVIPSTHWRNTIQFPDDPFRKAGPAGSPGWIKFLIFTSDPTRVYFQNSIAYPFHYDFATTFVQEYIGLTTQEFDQITLYAQGRQAILGAVILPYWTAYQPAGEQIKEYGIEFVGRDAYDPAQVVSLFNLVKSKVVASPGVQPFYFPAYEQMASAEEHRQYLLDHGITISSSSRWARGNTAYAPGWALGPLKFFPAAQIASAYLSGALAPGDILLTDGVPADMPVVAGIITTAPSTPNSHVAILANTYDLPFVHLALAADVARAQSLVGRNVALRVYGQPANCDARLIDVQDVLTPQQMQEILALKVPAPLNISPVTPYGAYSASTDGLWPEDIRHFGGKAANFGFLRRSIPDHSPVSLAFSFDVWNAFLDQTLANGRTLREEIASRLAGLTAYPPANMAALSATLHGIRENLFKSNSATQFSPALQHAILTALQDPQYSLDPLRKIRFRSSSNAEDSAQFTGAGLYDSFSGCLADDLDDDNVGPSACDASEPNERGVFRAIRRVFASFYNDNAYLGRLRYGMNESQVGMALLVHHSTPDPIELANGVAILERSGFRTTISLVTQHGATSVTNPVDGSIPEVIEVNVYSFGTYLTIQGYSNLVPMGATVLAWDSEYRTLVTLLVQASEAFRAWSGKTAYTLDFEYKKIAPEGRLGIKQIRELPQPGTTPSITPFLIDEPIVLEVFQGETNQPFGPHRLKSRWTLETRSMWLTPENLNDSLYAAVTLEYVDSDGTIRTQTGRPADWPEAAHAYHTTEPGYYFPFTADSWVLADMSNPRRYRLETHRPGLLVSPAQSPLLTLSDFLPLVLRVEHDRPVPERQYIGPQRVTEEFVNLALPFPPQSGDQLQTRMLHSSRNSATTQFYWPPDPSGVTAGYTAPLARWVQTHISGFTKQPIVLQSPYAQTYGPEHHNFSEHFVFEPRLEPGLSPSLLQELRAANIRVIHVFRDLGGNAVFTTYGFETAADFDADGDVDQDDLEIFAACLTAPDLGPPDWGCRSADFDRDGDVDQSDFGTFQRCLSGPQVPADPYCTGP